MTGPANVFCDNASVVTNTTIPQLKLNKKHLSIALHRCREPAARGVIRVAWEATTTMIADLLTKILPAVTRNKLMDMFMY